MARKVSLLVASVAPRSHEALQTKSSCPKGLSPRDCGIGSALCQHLGMAGGASWGTSRTLSRVASTSVVARLARGFSPRAPENSPGKPSSPKQQANIRNQNDLSSAPFSQNVLTLSAWPGASSSSQPSSERGTSSRRKSKVRCSLDPPTTLH